MVLCIVSVLNRGQVDRVIVNHLPRCWNAQEYYSLVELLVIHRNTHTHTHRPVAAWSLKNLYFAVFIHTPQYGIQGKLRQDNTLYLKTFQLISIFFVNPTS